jgi:hypothetical protein
VELLFRRCTRYSCRIGANDAKGLLPNAFRISWQVPSFLAAPEIAQLHLFGSGVSFTHASSARIFSIEE